MLLLIPIHKLELDNLLLDDKTKNNVINDSYFYRIYYSDMYVTFNAAYLPFELKNVKIEKYFDKIKCLFNYDENKKTIKEIIDLEKRLLHRCLNHIGNKGIYRIDDQLKHSFIKINDTINQTKHFKTKKFILKISGIWHTEPNIGLTFRFFLH